MPLFCAYQGNLSATNFRNESDYVAFETILREDVERYDVELLSYQLIENLYLELSDSE